VWRLAIENGVLAIHGVPSEFGKNRTVSFLKVGNKRAVGFSWLSPGKIGQR